MFSPAPSIWNCRVALPVRRVAEKDQGMVFEGEEPTSGRSGIHVRGRSNCSSNRGCDGSSARLQSRAEEAAQLFVHPYPRNPPPGRNVQERESKSRPIGKRANRRPEATSQIEKPSARAVGTPVWSGDEHAVGREGRLSIRPGTGVEIANPFSGDGIPELEARGVIGRGQELAVGREGHSAEARRGADQHDDIAARLAPEVSPDERARGLAAGIERDIAEDLLGAFGLGGLECLSGQSELRARGRVARTCGRDPGLPVRYDQPGRSPPRAAG